MSAEEVKREEDMEEMVADMIEDMSVGSKVTEPELAEPDFKENFYNYCMNSYESRGINPKVGYKPEGGQYVVEEDNESYKLNDISQMIQKSTQAKDEDMRKQAELTYHYLWSKEYLKFKQEKIQDKLLAIQERINQLKGKGVVKVDRRVADIFIYKIILYGNGVMDFRLNNLDEREMLLPEILETVEQPQITKPEVTLEILNDVINIEETMKEGELDTMPVFRFHVDYQSGKQTKRSIKRRFDVIVNMAV